MKRIRLLQWLLGLCGLVLWGRLCQLQWLDHSYWKKRGEQIRVWDESVPARRGRILDRNGIELADNQPWVGGQPLTPRRQALLAESGRDYEIQAERIYPAGSSCAHLLGYVGEGHAGKADWQGKEGLERQLETKLAGKNGWRRWLVTSQGEKLKLLQERPPTAGQDVRLTIELGLQQVAETALASVLKQLGSVRAPDDQPAGAVVVMEAESGRVLALASLPGFDPNLFVKSGHDAEISRLLGDRQAPLLNRVIAAQIPAASTFKIITATAAMHHGLIPNQRQFYCPGVRWIGGVPFHCFVRRGHGQLSFEETLAYSCDCAYYDLGLELKPTQLTDWARLWGLGTRTGLELPGEQSGYLPDLAQASQGARANLSIGQGDLLVTPLQMACVAAGVSNQGAIPRPSLFWQKTGWRSQVELPEADWARLRRGLEGAVNSGTAASAGGQGLGLAGKTGTVENSPSADNPRGYNHAWFVGYGRGLAIAVVLERSGGYGGALAAPVAVAIMRAYSPTSNSSL
ncbi:MAG: penicillin-binding transpeptidase domain-containing protein [Vulcanimicrobiota bacterium]